MEYFDGLGPWERPQLPLRGDRGERVWALAGEFNRSEIIWGRPQLPLRGDRGERGWALTCASSGQILSTSKSCSTLNPELLRSCPNFVEENETLPSRLTERAEQTLKVLWLSGALLRRRGCPWLIRLELVVLCRRAGGAEAKELW